MALSDKLRNIQERKMVYNGTAVTLYAPGEYLYLSKGDRNSICNGCGPGNWKFDIVPDRIYGLSIAEVCNIHDFMYYVGVSIQDKWFSDALFLLNGCLLIMHTSANSAMKTLRVLRMTKYYLAVALAGNSAFMAGKVGVHELK